MPVPIVLGFSIPILAYHNVERSPSNARLQRLYVTPQQFEWQLRTLRRLGFRGVSISEVLAALRTRSGSRLVGVTFDDGYLDNLTVAMPILQKYGFTATCYVVSNYIGTYNQWDAEQLGVRKPLMNGAQLKQWVNAGMEVGSHTGTHPRLDELDPTSAYDEIAGSRTTLSRLLDREVEHFCYPFGRFIPAVADYVRMAGYQSAVSTQRGIARASDDLYSLPRVSVHGDGSFIKFLLKVATRYEDLKRKRSAQ
jgi:peptidoglycan/xylan/chitin deacetylase (PgdA/CDA1 family)